MYDKITVAYFSEFSYKEDVSFNEMIKSSSSLRKYQLSIIRYTKLFKNSLSAVYNDALKNSKGQILLFVERKTKSISKGWGPTLLSMYNNSEYGILGLIGTTEMLYNKQQGLWFKDGMKFTGNLTGSFCDSKSIINLSNPVDFVIPVVAVHGNFMAVAKDRINSFFDEEFKGLTFYDTSFCIRNYSKGTKIGVVDTKYIRIISPFELYNFEQNRLLFQKKYYGNFKESIKINIPEANYPISYQYTNRIHIVIVTKNKIELLIQCLESIFEHTKYPHCYIWIADTGTSREHKLYLKKKIAYYNMRFPLKKLNIVDFSTKNRVNMIEFKDYNYSKINNEMVKLIRDQVQDAKDDFLVFSNNDIKLLNDCITGLFLEYKKFEKQGLRIGTLGVRLHYKNNAIQHLGIQISKVNSKIFMSHICRNEEYNYREDMETCVGNTGAFLFTKLSLFLELGMFNENYIDTCQDVEYNLSCLIKGYINYNLRHLVAYHYESQTRMEDNEKSIKELRDWEMVLFPYILRNLKDLEKHFELKYEIL